MSRDEAVKPDELESQLSAMFDGELPAAECELLSRRIDRDDNLRTRWSRYALIGAAMRCEPVATARSDFAARVSQAVDRATAVAEGDSESRAAGRGQLSGRAGTDGAAASAAARRTVGVRRLWWQSALAAALVVAVAGLSISMLRSVALGPGRAAPAVAVLAVTTGAAPRAVVAQSPGDLLARARQAAAILGLAAPTLGAAAARVSAGGAATQPVQSREPWSYVTPSAQGAGSTPLRTELVDYIVAHSEYSTPLVRPDLLSEVISSGEDAADGVTSPAGAAGVPAAAGPGAAAGELDAINPPAAAHP